MSNRTEQAIARSIGADPIKNSGRGTRKGDATWRGFLVDFKETSRSFSLNPKVWAKVCSDALTHQGLDPALIVVFDTGQRLAIIEVEVLEQLLDAMEEK